MTFAGHTLFANPHYMDAEVNGGFGVGDWATLNGFVGIVPTTFGNGGSHYGELKATLPLFRRSLFSVGPAVERVTSSGVADFSKFGIGGRAGIGGANFNWEIFPYATENNPGSVSTWYAFPLFGR